VHVQSVIRIGSVIASHCTSSSGHNGKNYSILVNVYVTYCNFHSTQCYLSNVSEEIEAVGLVVRSYKEYDFQIAVDDSAVGVHASIEVVARLNLSQCDRISFAHSLQQTWVGFHRESVGSVVQSRMCTVAICTHHSTWKIVIIL